MTTDRMFKPTLSKTLLASLLSAAALMPASVAQEKSDPARKDRFDPKECVFPELKLPEDFVVYATGGSSGRRLDYQIDDQSNSAGTQMDVVVNFPSQPIVLMVGANSPTIWNVQWTEDTEIIGVVATGYYRQAVAGLPKETPILISTYDNGAKCGYGYPEENNYEVLNPFSQKLFGQEVKAISRAAGYGLNSIGQPLEEDPELLSSDDTPVESFLDYDAPLAGRAGIEAALAKGILREATEEDFQAWSELREQLAPKQDVPELAGGYPDTYVVLDEFTYPAGLYGSSAIRFFVPNGVSQPRGNSGHSVTYNFNTGKCLGSVCPFLEDIDGTGSD